MEAIARRLASSSRTSEHNTVIRIADSTILLDSIFDSREACFLYTSPGHPCAAPLPGMYAVRARMKLRRTTHNRAATRRVAAARRAHSLLGWCSHRRRCCASPQMPPSNQKRRTMTLQSTGTAAAKRTRNAQTPCEQHAAANLTNGDEMATEAPDTTTGSAGSASGAQPGTFHIDNHEVVGVPEDPVGPDGLFDVGGNHHVRGVSDDPVGLVGCSVVVPWDGTCHCVVDAYAPDAPGGPAYIISWCSKRDEHHLLSCAKMAERGAQCSHAVKANAPRRRLSRRCARRSAPRRTRSRGCGDCSRACGRAAPGRRISTRRSTLPTRAHGAPA